jgi:hypothetical protein
MRLKLKAVMGKKKNQSKRKNPYDWTRRGQYWKQLLDHIQPMVERAKPIGGEISRERWDAPELKMQWSSSDDIGRAIQVLISETAGKVKLLINGSAWKDSKQERHWKTMGLKTIPIRRDPEKLDLSALYEDLSESQKIVSGWTETDLENTDALPCQSCN